MLQDGVHDAFTTRLAETAEAMKVAAINIANDAPTLTLPRLRGREVGGRSSRRIEYVLTTDLYHPYVPENRRSAFEDA